MEASLGLEAFIDESIRRSVEKGYNPTTFIGMRKRHGTKEAIARLVVSSDIQSGFTRLKELNLLDWSIEAAALQFPNEFTEDVREAAKWRLEQARAGVRI